ncbi:MAG: sulfatase [Planctomycetota bacterium]|nr:sulfatase [Planctomycetota bacterium]MDA1163416.1 sulfatase [Planctomycetota bacterium]
MKTLLLFAVGTFATCVVAAERPNVLFILADDLGWRDLSVEGSTFYESPNIDRIARSGMRFTQGYAGCQVCSPSRASIMLGKTPARHGITDWIGAAEGTAWNRNTRLLPAKYVHALPSEDTSLAESFQEAGYRTFFAGKWHLGDKGSFPEDHGFEINVGGHHRGSPPGGFFAPYNNPKMTDGPAGESLPLRLGRETAKFIDGHAKEPFFAYLSFYSVHAPIQSTKHLWAKYRDKASKLPTPDHRFIVDRTSPVRQVQDHPVYAGMIEAMDDAVGIALAALDRNGLTDNTIIVFTSDNGGVSAGDGKATSNLPLRGGKGRQWEGGIREPYHISWPGVVAPGSTCDVPVTGADFFPTLLAMTGQNARPEQHVDGVNLVPLLKGGSIANRPLFWHYPHYGNQGGEPSAIIRDGDWKLIHYYEDGRDELYNLAADAGEQTDVAAANTERATALRHRLDMWLAETGAQMPVPNPKFSEQRWQNEQLQTRQQALPGLESQARDFLQPDYAPRGWWGSEN